PLPARGVHAPDLGHHRRAVRYGPRVGRPRAGAVLLLDRRLDARRRLAPALSAGGDRHHCVLRVRALDLPRLERPEEPLQARPRDEDLGTPRGDRGRPPPRLRLVGDRPPPQLHGRGGGLSLDRAPRRRPLARTIPAPPLARVAPRAPRAPRRASLPAEVRRPLERVLRAGAVPDGSVPVLSMSAAAPGYSSGGRRPRSGASTSSRA